MGSVRKRNNQWNAQVRIKGWRPLSKTFQTKKLAEQWVQATEASVRSKELGLTTQADMTLSEACTKYADVVSTHHKGANVEIHRLKSFSSSPLGCLKLHSINRHHITDYFDARSNYVTTSTLRREFLLLKRLFAVAIKQWNAPMLTNPMEDLQAPPSGPSRTRRIRADEWETIIREAQKQRNPLIRRVIEFAYETGMRRSEILNLRTENIDFTRQIAYLQDTKNGEDRAVALSQRAIEIISQGQGSCYVFETTESAVQQGEGVTKTV